MARYQDDGNESIGKVLRLHWNTDDIAVALQLYCTGGHDTTSFNGEQGCSSAIG